MNLTDQQAQRVLDDIRADDIAAAIRRVQHDLTDIVISGRASPNEYCLAECLQEVCANLLLLEARMTGDGK